MKQIIFSNSFNIPLRKEKQRNALKYPQTSYQCGYLSAFLIQRETDKNLAIRAHMNTALKRKRQEMS